MSFKHLFLHNILWKNKCLPYVCGSSVWIMLHASLLAPKILGSSEIFKRFVNPCFK
jgi:hypothetical protein